MWSALEGNPSASAGGHTSSSSGAAPDMTGGAWDPASLLSLNTQLASALRLTGDDAQYWEESISPQTVRQELSKADPSNVHSTPVILKGVKWLLASISKGRNVVEFYPHVVKLVGAVSLEVRKLVYLYLVRYANHDATTRELSLLSINSFQRGLADAESPRIRALALRVLTSLGIPDIMQIQILSVQKCASDASPYVRKCAANALSKLHRRCVSSDEENEDSDEDNVALLRQICQDLLWYDAATMVLTSALIAWHEMFPNDLAVLHGCFRKFCHLLTDLDEWGQVVVLNVFSRYCRLYFCQPPATGAASAERIDRERRVRRTIYGLEPPTLPAAVATAPAVTAADQAALAGVALPPRAATTQAAAQKVKRRVVKTAFYSDEEDETTEEEVYAATPNGPSVPVATAMRQRNVLGLPKTEEQPFVPRALLPNNSQAPPASTANGPTANPNVDDDKDVYASLDKDHATFLKAALHLLKSRNAGVVLAVCHLHYYCGVSSSIATRAALGKALVRIHRDPLREIQYVVLASIRTLAAECPSAFSPFLSDFFVKGLLDPPFTRLLKLEILTSLALEPVSMDAVLGELGTYVRQPHDVTFACAAVRAVGRVVELARIVHDRRRQLQSSTTTLRADANRRALNALHGLLTLTQVGGGGGSTTSTLPPRAVVGEAVLVMRLVLQLLQDDCGHNDKDDNNNNEKTVHDPHGVQARTVQRLLVLLLQTLSHRISQAANTRNLQSANKQDVDDDEDEDEDEEDETATDRGTAMLKAAASVDLPPEATAAALWVVGEHLLSSSSTTQPFGDADRPRIRVELLRMVVRAFPDLTPVEKEQAVHVASKWILASLQNNKSSATGEAALCEQVLALGRLDVHVVVRDGARLASALLHSVSGLKHDLDALEVDTVDAALDKNLTLDQVQRILLLQTPKPAPSSLPLEKDLGSHETGEAFRFGTLSSLVGHAATGTAYMPLPPWAAENSPSALRNPPAAADKPGGGTTQTSRAQVSALTTVGSDLQPGGTYKDSRPEPPGGGGQQQPRSSAAGFYGESSSSSSSSSDDSSFSSDDDDDSSSSSSSSSSDDSDSSADRGAPAPGHAQLPTEASTTVQTNHLLAATTTTPVVQVQTVPESEDDSDDDEDSSDDEEHQQTTKTSDNLVLMEHNSNSVPPNGNSAKAVVADDLQGLVLAAPVGGAQPNNGQEEESNSSDWIQLVRPDHTGGLSVRGRYLWGPAKQRALAQLVGGGKATADKPTLVCVQLWLQSQPNSPTVFRRLKWVQKSSTSTSSSIAPKRCYLPAEMEQLAPSQETTHCFIGLEFAQASDRDGTLVAKLDLKYGSSGAAAAVEIKPSLADVLQPNPTVLVLADFDAAVRRLQGFSRVETKLTTGGAAHNDDALHKAVEKAAALTPVGGGSDRWVATLPESGSLVYVQLLLDSSTAAKVMVCSDNALAANSMAGVLKRKIQTSLQQQQQ